MATLREQLARPGSFVVSTGIVPSSGPAGRRHPSQDPRS